MTDLQPTSGGMKEGKVVREFDAPRTLVFAALAEEGHFAKWFGAAGTTLRSCSLDCRPGGIAHYEMVGPDGGSMWGKFIFEEVVAPERLVYVNMFSDEQGGVRRHPLSPTWPLKMRNTVELEEVHANKTRLTLRFHPVDPSEDEYATFIESLNNVKVGTEGMFKRLEEYIAEL
ncbi:SRPBCC domain-containing protein [bacterium]|nr:SRPBCC domain-containing protein [bacterium]